MDEVVVRSLIIGAVFMVIGVTASLIWKLIRSPSEGARRTRWVLGAAGAVLLVALFLNGSSSDKGFLATVAAAIVAIVWIIKGFRAKP